MACGQAKLIHARTSKKVAITDRNNERRWYNDAWRNVHYIAQPHEHGDFEVLQNGPRVRPYIESFTPSRWVWREFECEPGDIALSDSEIRYSRKHSNRIVVEPTIKQGASPNKQWEIRRWREFVQLARQAGFQLTQLGPLQPTLRDVEFIQTPTIRHALSIMCRATAYVGHEGALHHVAAVFKTPAIVIRGGYISPRVTGYEGHIDFFSGDGLGCGNRNTCFHCRTAMLDIDPAHVLQSLMGLLRT